MGQADLGQAVLGLGQADFDQGRIYAPDIVRRVYTAARSGHLTGANVLVIGDDDAFGLCAALSGLPEIVTVLEADARIIEFAKIANGNYGTRVAPKVYDIRDGLAESDKGMRCHFKKKRKEKKKCIFLYIFFSLLTHIDILNNRLTIYIFLPPPCVCVS